jgi:cell division protein FtsW (lipid II flippase)
MTEARTTPRSNTAPLGSKQSVQEKIRVRLREPARLRNLELVLLLVAVGISLGSIVLVQLGAIGSLDNGMITLAAIPCVLALIAHVGLRVTARDADPFLLPIALTLNGLGIAMIHRLDIAEDTTGWGGFGVRQIVWTILAMVLAIAVLVLIRNHRVLARYRYIAMITAIALLLLPMLPIIGQEINGARLWVSIGPFSFQPGELAKIALAVFFAGYLMTARESLSMMGKKVLWMRFPRGRDLGPILVIWAVAMGVLIFQRDLGTSLLYFGLFLVMIYVATGRGSWIVLGLSLFFGGALIAASTLGYVQGRVNSWLNPFDPALYEQGGGSYQLVQGMFGFANGELIGTGWGLGRPDIVPLAESDYIIPSLGEELGLVGVFAILALYLLFISRGFRIGFAGQDDFGRLLGVGLSFVLALQVFVVIGGVTRVIPLTGLTTPFLAAGGSSLVANWIIVALLLRLSDTVRTEPRGGGDR